MHYWLLNQLRDRSRTAKWYHDHRVDPNDYWLGEVDYTGDCRPEHDRDCDHWYDETDNCPNTWNIDQFDGDDNGVGGSCENGPAVPTGCVVTNHCDETLSFQCDPLKTDAELVLESQNLSDGQPWAPGGGLTPNKKWQYRVCAVTGAGKACTGVLPLDSVCP